MTRQSLQQNSVKLDHCVGEASHEASSRKLHAKLARLALGEAKPNPSRLFSTSLWPICDLDM